MKVAVTAFSKAGKEKINDLCRALPDIDFQVREQEEDLKSWVENAFLSRTDIVFIGACGIATRSIAPFIKSKLEDPAVVCMDEMGKFVIPILSGHVGGANELTCKIAEKIGALPVITTASDINDSFAIDSFAKENNLGIENKDGIVKVTSALLEGKPITLSIKDFPPSEKVNVVITDKPDECSQKDVDLILRRKMYTLGIGCKKGKSAEEIENAVMRELTRMKLTINDIYAIGTIDIKENEPGIQALSHKYRIPIFSFTASLLQKAPGDYQDSEFVKETVGVGNVCERAAILAAGAGAKIILDKQSLDGITIAVAKRFVGQEDF